MLEQKLWYASHTTLHCGWLDSKENESCNCCDCQSSKTRSQRFLWVLKTVHTANIRAAGPMWREKHRFVILRLALFMRLPSDRVRGRNLFNLSRSQFPLRRASVVQNLEVSSHAKSRNREFQNSHLAKSVELCQFGPWGQELRAVCRKRANRPILFLWSFGWDFHRLKIYFWTSDGCRRVKRRVISTLGRITLHSICSVSDKSWEQNISRKCMFPKPPL